MALKQALVDPVAGDWAPMLARVVAAEARDLQLLAKAHRALADKADEDTTAASHLAASARATARAGDTEGAITTLRSALERFPGHRYAVSLLEELLRAAGTGILTAHDTGHPLVLREIDDLPPVLDVKGHLR